MIPVIGSWSSVLIENGRLYSAAGKRDPPLSEEATLEGHGRPLLWRAEEGAHFWMPTDPTPSRLTPRRLD